MRRLRLRSRRAFTLVELLVAVLLIDVALLALVAGSVVVVRRQNALRARLAAAQAASNRLQTLRAMPCAAGDGRIAGERGIVETWHSATVADGRRQLRDSVAYADGRDSASVVLATSTSC